LPEKQISKGATEGLIVRNHTPFTINVQLKIRNKEGLNKFKTAVISPNSEYASEPEKENSLVDGIMINGIKTLAGDSYFGGSEKEIILQEARVSRALCGGTRKWDVFAQFLGQAASGLPLSVSPAQVRFVLTEERIPFAFSSPCRLSSIVYLSPLFDFNTGTLVTAVPKQAI